MMRLLKFVLVVLLIASWLVGISWLQLSSTNQASSQQESLVAGGFAAAQARYLQLTARKSDLELQGQFINQSRIRLSNQVGILLYRLSNLDPKSEEAASLQEQITKLQQLDKELELKLRQVDTQRQAIQTELEATQKAIATNIQSSFKTFNGDTDPEVAATAHNDIGIELERQGKLPEAIEQYQLALEKSPSFTDAQINLEEARLRLEEQTSPSPETVPTEEEDPWSPYLRAVVRIIARRKSGEPHTGTGWVVKREGNLAWIVTNCHVVSEPTISNVSKCTSELSTTVEVEFYSEPPPGKKRRRATAKIEHITLPDEALDLAVLKVINIPEDIKPLGLSTGRLPRGVEVSIIGHPDTADVNWLLVFGEVPGGYRERFTLDANLATGNSGSPVLNEDKQVVGIVFAVRLPEYDQGGTGGFSSIHPADFIRQKLADWGVL